MGDDGGGVGGAWRGAAGNGPPPAGSLADSSVRGCPMESDAMDKLAEADIEARLAALPEWTQQGENIQRTYKFADFAEAMAFVNRIAEHAERVKHHPDILIRWNKVMLTLSTHDAGGLTAMDFDFADAADGLASPVEAGSGASGGSEGGGGRKGKK